MKKFYGSLIIFFYFLKYPILIYVAISHFYLKINIPIIMWILAVISLILVFKDIFIKSREDSWFNYIFVLKQWGHFLAATGISIAQSEQTFVFGSGASIPFNLL